MASKKGQTYQRDISNLFIAIIIISAAFLVFTVIITIGLGRIDSSPDAFLNALIPLLILLIFVRFFQRLLE